MKIFVCRICKADAHVFVQPALRVGRSRVLQIHCKTVGCPNHLLTTDERDTALVDQRFTVEDTTETEPDTLRLELLFRNAKALQRMAG